MLIIDDIRLQTEQARHSMRRAVRCVKEYVRQGAVAQDAEPEAIACRDARFIEASEWILGVHPESTGVA